MPTPFEHGNPGKPKGAINKTTRLVKETFAQVFSDLQDDPYVKLSEWAKKEPTEFYKLASKLIPTQMTVDVTNTPLMQIDPINDTSADNGVTEDSGT